MTNMDSDIGTTVNIFDLLDNNSGSCPDLELDELDTVQKNDIDVAMLRTLLEYTIKELCICYVIHDVRNALMQHVLTTLISLGKPEQAADKFTKRLRSRLEQCLSRYIYAIMLESEENNSSENTNFTGWFTNLAEYCTDVKPDSHPSSWPEAVLFNELEYGLTKFIIESLVAAEENFDVTSEALTYRLAECFIRKLRIGSKNVTERLEKIDVDQIIECIGLRDDPATLLSFMESLMSYSYEAKTKSIVLDLDFSKVIYEASGISELTLSTSRQIRLSANAFANMPRLMQLMCEQIRTDTFDKIDRGDFVITMYKCFVTQLRYTNFGTKILMCIPDDIMEQFNEIAGHNNDVDMFDTGNTFLMAALGIRPFLSLQQDWFGLWNEIDQWFRIESNELTNTDEQCYLDSLIYWLSKQQVKAGLFFLCYQWNSLVQIKLVQKYLRLLKQAVELELIEHFCLYILMPSDWLNETDSETGQTVLCEELVDLVDDNLLIYQLEYAKKKMHVQTSIGKVTNSKAKEFLIVSNNEELFGDRAIELYIKQFS